MLNKLFLKHGERRSFRLATGDLEGLRIPVEETEGYVYLDRFAEKAVRKGGLLVLQQDISSRPIISEDPTAAVYRVGRRSLWLWYFAQCTFERSLCLLEEFGLFLPVSGPESPPDRQNKLSAVNNLIRELRRRHKVVIQEIWQRHVTIAKMDKNATGWREDVERVLEFNINQMKRESPWGLLDVREIFVRERFVIVGF